MPPSSSQTNGSQPCLWPSLHISFQATLQSKTLQLACWCRPRLQRIISDIPHRCRLNHQFQLGTVELRNTTGISAGEHRLQRFPAQPEHHREQDDGTREENVLHAD